MQYNASRFAPCRTTLPCRSLQQTPKESAVSERRRVHHAKKRKTAKAPRISVSLTPEFDAELRAAARKQGASVSWFAHRLLLRGWEQYKRDGRL